MMENLESRQLLSTAPFAAVLEAHATDPALAYGPAKSGKTLAARRAALLDMGLTSTDEVAQAVSANSTNTAKPFVSGRTLAARRASMGTYLLTSPDGRTITTQSGTPFFYMADTAWHLFDKTNQKSAGVYLDNRAAKGFTVIQAEINARFRTGNAFGEHAFINGDPLQPNEAYFKHVDYVVNLANTLGMWVALVPFDSTLSKNGTFTKENAWQFGRYLGRRYATNQIIWTLGGDVAGDDNPAGPDLWREAAAGIARGATNRDQSKLTIQYFPTQSQASTNWFLNDEWLDLNVLVSGHSQNQPNYNNIAVERAKNPIRPVMDGESVYEYIPFGLNAINARATDWDTRKNAYWGVFAGGHGVTFGNNNVWQFVTNVETNRSFATAKWDVSLDSLGAYSMSYLKRLMTSRPQLGRVPDQAIVTSSTLTGPAHIQAIRGADSSWAMVYSGAGSAFTVDLTKLSGTQIDVRWYNPRNAKSAYVERVAKSGTKTYTPPSAGVGQDWVLVLDDASKLYGRP